MDSGAKYRAILKNLIDEIGDSQSEPISKAAAAVADCLQKDGIIYVLGSGHSLLPAYEIHNRAGGLAPVNVILDPGFGRAERVPGYAETIFSHARPEPGSVLIVISNSGRNALPIEMALLAKGNQMTVVAITSLAHSRAVTSRHPSAKRLFEIADVVIDNCGIAGDAAVEVEGMSAKMGATSSIAAICIVNSIIIEAAEELVSRGITPPAFISANLDGADEHNEKFYERYHGRVRWL